MASTRKLSSDEVNALIEGLGSDAASPSAIMDGEDVRPFQFGSDDLSLLGDYHALRIINETICPACALGVSADAADSAAHFLVPAGSEDIRRIYGWH